MSAGVNSFERCQIFAYKVQRKFRRELRKRYTPFLIARDLKGYRAVIRHKDSRSLLLDYADLQGAGWPKEWTEWLSEEEAIAVLKKADDILEHRFDLLGSGSIELGSPIHWSKDIKTGFEWSRNVHHLNIAWDDVPTGTDVKMPWELSRCQHFIPLALAEHIKGNGLYYQEFKDQVRSWIEENKCGFGVNWMCAMDVAIRAVNWLTAVSLFKDNLQNDEDGSFADEITESLWLHACHIMRNLEWQGPKSASLANHFLADICGVLAMGTLFRDCSQGNKWLKFSHQWFETEVRRQVFEDGSNFETSTSYHRLSFEMFQWANLVTKALSIPFSPLYDNRLSGMARFVSAYTSPSGQAVQFGDNDGGRLLTAGIEDPCDHRYLLLGECGFGGVANRILFGGGVESGDDDDGAFKQGGYWFGECNNGWVGIRAGVVSHGGAHAHADQLSLTLTVQGHDVIVDPGTGIYSGDVEKRNHYRSTAAHNAPQLNDFETNRFPSGMTGLFRMSDDTKTEVTRWERSLDKIDFAAKHDGYSQYRSDCECERKVKLVAGMLVVEDKISGLVLNDNIGWSFRLAPGVVAGIDEGKVRLTVANLEIYVFVDPGMECEVIEVLHSPTYGVEVPSYALVMKRKVQRAGEVTQEISFSWDGQQ